MELGYRRLFDFSAVLDDPMVGVGIPFVAFFLPGATEDSEADAIVGITWQILATKDHGIRYVRPQRDYPSAWTDLSDEWRSRWWIWSEMDISLPKNRDIRYRFRLYDSGLTLKATVGPVEVNTTNGVTFDIIGNGMTWFVPTAPNRRPALASWQMATGGDPVTKVFVAPAQAAATLEGYAWADNWYPEELTP